MCVRLRCSSVCSDSPVQCCLIAMPQGNTVKKLTAHRKTPGWSFTSENNKFQFGCCHWNTSNPALAVTPFFSFMPSGSTVFGCLKYFYDILANFTIAPICTHNPKIARKLTVDYLKLWTLFTVEIQNIPNELQGNLWILDAGTKSVYISECNNV